MAQFRAAILEAIEKGEFDYAESFPNSKKAKKYAPPAPAEGLSVASFLVSWLGEREGRLAASTWDGYRKIVNGVLIPALGKIDLADLRRVDVKDMLKDRDCSNKRLRNILSVLRTALDDAVSDEFLDLNPIHGWTYQNLDEVKDDSDDVDPFTAQEQVQILAHCPPQFYNMIKFALWSGLRTSEYIALDWDDIDFERKTIRVNKALTQAAKTIEPPKTKAGIRTVKMLQPAEDALREQYKVTGERGLEVFRDPQTGRRWAGDLAIREKAGNWQDILKAAGVRYRRPYQTRHTYASMMLSAGEHEMWVAQQMGHSDVTMIRRNYGRFMPEVAPNAGQKAVQAFVMQNQESGPKSGPCDPK